MKTTAIVRLAMWLIEHKDGAVGEAFAGDVLESFGKGRSEWWCLSQALRRWATVTGLRLSTWSMPLLYCVAFVLLYPLWQRMYGAFSSRALTSNGASPGWPGSAIVELAQGLVPAVLFLWTGVLAFIFLRPKLVRPAGLVRVALSLSVSFGVISLEAAIWLRLGWVQPDLRILSHADFFYPISHSHFSALLFLSLLAGLALLPREGPIRQAQPGGWHLTLHGMKGALRALGMTMFLIPHVAAQSIKPQGAAGKRLVQLLDSFDGNDWNQFHTAYIASFVGAPADVPLDIEFFRHRTGGLDLRKLEEDAPDHATVLVQEHDSDQFARISVQVEPGPPHRFKQLNMGPIERPAEFPYGVLTEGEVITQARTRLHALADAGRFSGVMLIQRNGHTVYSDVLGEANRAKHLPNTLDSRFRIGSMNKMFTAVATLQLVAAGKLQLDAPLGRYLPAYPNKDAAAKVTIRELLSHTGGTGDFFGPEFDSHRLSLRMHEDFVALFGPRPLRFEPGTRFEYSNYGFLILGAVIDRVSGESYYQYVQDHVYAPAGMVTTGSEPEDVLVPGRVIGYTQMDGTTSRPNDEFLPYRGASAGGGYTTAGDLLRFADALERGKLLNTQETRLLTTATGIPGGGEGYGLGFQIEREPSGVCFGHTGGSPGQAAMLEICPQAGYTIVWLSNTDPPGALLLTEYLLHRLPQQESDRH